MNEKPVITVVMGVYNGGKCLRETVDSVLAQAFEDFEFVIVNDGSTDNTGEILKEYAKKDPRIRIISQQNQGLTRALITGCGAARGEYIARQDCGDISKPERLAKQLEHIRADNSRVLVSCRVNFFGPAGEFLFTTSPDHHDASAQNSLLNARPDSLRGIGWHGTAFFPTEIYRKAGGYRPEFYFAQDMDLWVRLVKYGKVTFCPEVLYEAKFREGEISGVYRDEQLALTKIIVALRDLDPAGPEYQQWMEEARRIRPQGKKIVPNRRKAEQMFFLGSCLRSRKDPRCRDYFLKCVKLNPFHLKAWFSLLSFPGLTGESRNGFPLSRE
jgi:glycosyltransferase involved in cell wall biosynthesis